MADELEALLGRVRRDKAVLLGSEEGTRQGAVLPILAALGWDRDNIREVFPEFSVGNGRVDYCLRIQDDNCLFIEVKRASEDLESHQEQLLEYAFREGVKIAVLTNGVLWWLYLPLFQGSWEQRKFLAIDIEQQDNDKVARHLRSFLSRQAVADGDALKSAEELHKSRQKDTLVRQTLGKAWNELCQEPDERLLELFAEKVESLCGHRPDNQMVSDDLLQRYQSSLPSEPRPVSPKTKPPRMHVRKPRQSRAGSYTFSRATGFVFCGQRKSVRSFREILLQLCEELHRRHSGDFDRVLSLRGRSREYFSRDYRSMRDPREIAGTGIYVEINLSANDIITRCRQLLSLFGYQRHDFDAETERK